MSPRSSGWSQYFTSPCAMSTELTAAPCPAWHGVQPNLSVGCLLSSTSRAGWVANGCGSWSNPARSTPAWQDVQRSTRATAWSNALRSKSFNTICWIFGIFGRSNGPTLSSTRPSSFCCKRSRSFSSSCFCLSRFSTTERISAAWLVYCCICACAWASWSSISFFSACRASTWACAASPACVVFTSSGATESNAWSYSYQPSSSLLLTMRNLRSHSSTCTFAAASACCAAASWRAVSPLAMLACASASALLTSWYFGSCASRLSSSASAWRARSICSSEKSTWYFFHGLREMLSSHTAQAAPISSRPTASRKTALYERRSSSIRSIRRAITSSLRRRPPLHHAPEREDREPDQHQHELSPHAVLLGEADEQRVTHVGDT